MDRPLKWTVAELHAWLDKATPEQLERLAALMRLATDDPAKADAFLLKVRTDLARTARPLPALAPGWRVGGRHDVR
jgi:hypothetical protein